MALTTRLPFLELCPALSSLSSDLDPTESPPYTGADACSICRGRVSVPTEPALGHLRCHLTDVPPQTNCLPDAVFGVPRPSTRCRRLKAHTVIPFWRQFGKRHLTAFGI
ncbi:hypothetical protein TNCV_2675811 [Trichonephila clavipes]|nr:hypothetical protein TNCV_2675811 [Trichonephila clavipes]